jgi:hypothetical protein
LLKVSSPAILHYPRSFIEAISYDMSFVPEFFNRAALTEDPVERLKLVVTAIIAAQHINPGDLHCRSPLNPILGETV